MQNLEAKEEVMYSKHFSAVSSSRSDTFFMTYAFSEAREEARRQTKTLIQNLVEDTV